MNDKIFFSDFEKYLKVLNYHLELNNKKIEFVVCGGTALNAMGFVSRVTKDIDVLGFVENNDNNILIEKAIFPDWLKEIINKISRDFNIPKDWLNTGPTSMIDLGLPADFEKRLSKKDYGSNLSIYYISRIDQIYFKLYACADRGGYHLDDLKKLNPSSEELLNASLWCMTQDISEGFKTILKDLLAKMGYEDVSERI
ncbi:MAG: hypothetical protein PWQ77_830 [Kosmotogales bacterium]|nr:hypothetical protein [Kosmotogales bacterium]